MSRARDIANIGDGVTAADITDATITAAKMADGAVEGAFTTQIGRRNLIINGAMQVAQRGTSSTSAGYQTVDRFTNDATALDELVVTRSQSSDAPDGFSNSYKLDVDTAETAIAVDERFRVMQAIEAQDLQQLSYGTASAQSVTLSFYVKSNVTGDYALHVYSEDGSRDIGSTYTISSADTWERKTITISGDASGTINNDNGSGLRLEWFLIAGSNFTGTDNTSWAAFSTARFAYGHTAVWGTNTADYWQITGVQLEVGSVATPFEHRSYGEELALCQRYFYLFNPTSTTVLAGTRAGASTVNFSIPTPVTLRAAPTYTTNDQTTFVARGGGSNGSATATSFSNDAGNVVTLTMTVGFVPSTSYAYTVYATSLGDHSFDAEL